MKNKIALIGVAGSGKDYLTSHLINNYNFTKVAFADSLKELCSDIFPWLSKDYPAYEKENPLNITLEDGTLISATPRDIWILLGQIPQIDKRFFIRKLEDKVNNLDNNIIISDCRTQDELDWCKQNNFITIYIAPKEVIYKSNEYDQQVYNLVDQCDYLFENHFDGSYEFDNMIKNIIS